MLGGGGRAAHRRCGGCARPLPRKRRLPHLAAAAPPLRGTTTADVVSSVAGTPALVRAADHGAGTRRAGRAAGGGHLRRGTVGRNGGFVTSWWDTTDLIRAVRRRRRDRHRARHGSAVDEVGAFCQAHSSTPGSRRPGRCPRARPGQDDGCCGGPCATGQRAGRFASSRRRPRFGRGPLPVFAAGRHAGAATVKPATLARGLRACCSSEA